MAYEEDEEYEEVHTGTGKVLILFLGLVVVCAVFFGLGYSMGRNAAKVPGSVIPTAQAATDEAGKPSPAVPADNAGSCPAGQDCSASPSTQGGMTFYQAVQQKDANAQLTPPAASKPAAAPAAPPPQVSPAMPGYSVQVAAVSKQEDAQALVDALHQKQYPAFVTSSPTDKFLHVQVGPYTELKDATAMKAKLQAEGYNPIVKR